MDIFDKQGVIAYIGQHAPSYGLDPAAVLAVANHEGLNTTPGSSWKLQGESNISFGPPSWYGNGAGGPLIAQHGASAPAWSWSAAGLDYWLQSVAKAGASGLTGVSAIRAIVTGFERPRADLVAGEIGNASADYAKMQAAIGGAVPIATPTSAFDGVTATDPAGAQAGTSQATGAGAGSPDGTKLASIGGMALNVPSGLVLGVLGALLLLLGALLFAFNIKLQQPSVNIKTPQVST